MGRAGLFRLIKRCLLLGTVTAIVVAVAAWWGLQQYLQQPLHVPEDGVVLEVTAGSSIIRVAQQLAENEIVEWPEPLVLYARFTEKTTIRAGEYQLLPSDTPQTLLEKLITGEVIHYQITFPEGLTLQEWLALLSDHPELTDTAKLLSMEGIQQRFALDHPEGWFFPETYQFTGAESTIGVLAQAHLKMQSVLEEEWQQRSENLPYQTSYEALIMASIVEKETGRLSEQQQIAGVFIRRLQKGMRLQTDPTVIYGLGARYQGNLTRRHLKEATPYNTYRIKGLPPTPIAMPGRAAIHAALHPDKGSTLYFVAKGDGSHQFSDSLEQHLKAVRKYQLKRRSGYRSAP